MPPSSSTVHTPKGPYIICLFLKLIYIAAFVGLFVLVVESIALYTCASLFIHSPVGGCLG